MTNAAKDDAPGLLPCPFCGSGPALTIGNAMFSGVEVLDHHGRFWVNCGTCGGQGPSEGSESEAIAAWNRRSPEALAASPVVQAMLREARAEGMGWAAAIAAETAADAKKEPGTGWASHSWLMAVCRTLEAEAAAVRKGETK